MEPNTEKACTRASSVISGAISPTNTWKWLPVSSFTTVLDCCAQLALISFNPIDLVFFSFLRFA